MYWDFDAQCVIHTGTTLCFSGIGSDEKKSGDGTKKSGDGTKKSSNVTKKSGDAPQKSGDTPKSGTSPASPSIERFITAYKEHYATAYEELSTAPFIKQTHWMWYIWPIPRNEGHPSSEISQTYSLGKGETLLFLQNEYLRERFMHITDLVSARITQGGILKIMFGDTDAAKFQISVQHFAESTKKLLPNVHNVCLNACSLACDFSPQPFIGFPLAPLPVVHHRTEESSDILQISNVYTAYISFFPADRLKKSGDYKKMYCFVVFNPITQEWSLPGGTLADTQTPQKDEALRLYHEQCNIGAPLTRDQLAFAGTPDDKTVLFTNMRPIDMDTAFYQTQFSARTTPLVSEKCGYACLSYNKDKTTTIKSLDGATTYKDPDFNTATTRCFNSIKQFRQRMDLQQWYTSSGLFPILNIQHAVRLTALYLKNRYPTFCIWPSRTDYKAVETQLKTLTKPPKTFNINNQGFRIHKDDYELWMVPTTALALYNLLSTERARLLKKKT